MDYVRAGRLIVRTGSMKPINLRDPMLLRAAQGADVFLDTAIRFREGDENDASQNQKFVEDLYNLQRLGARTVIGIHHSPKGFAKENFMSLENTLRGTGDIGAMVSCCWSVRQIDKEHNRIFVDNVKARDFEAQKPFIIQGRPSIDATGYFDLTEPPGFAGELSDHLTGEKRAGRPASPDKEEKVNRARALQAAGMSLGNIAKDVGVSKSTISDWLKA